MLSYFEYKILKEADTPSPAGPNTGAAQVDSLPNTPSSLPSPATGVAPGSDDPMGLGLGGSSPDSMPSLDMGMGGPSVGGGDQSSPKPLDLKFSNVWDAFEKLLNNK